MSSLPPRVVWTAPSGIAVPVAFPAGTVLFRPGESCPGLLLLSAGAIRVMLVSEAGRQITLYRVVPDVACVLSTQCLIEGGEYPAEGIAETDITGVFLPASHAAQCFRNDALFRQWLFQGYGGRLTDLVLLVDDLLGPRIDRRVAGHLIHLGRCGDRLEITHQAIAAEIGTVREVVSRHLKDFERRGAVRLGRGVIHLLDRAALTRWAEGRNLR